MKNTENKLSKKSHRSQKQRVKRGRSTAFISVLLVTALAGLGLFGMYRSLLQNAAAMGSELAKSYANDEERNLAVYDTLVQMGMSCIKDIEAEGLDEEQAEAKMLHYFEDALKAANDPDLHCYAIVNGHMCGNVFSKERAKTYDYSERDWYKQALEADGKMIFTNAYKNVNDGQDVVSAAAADPKTGNAILIDINSTDIENIHADLTLPEQAAYYLVDAKGDLLYSKAPFNVDKQSLEDYAAGICSSIKSGEISAAGDRIIDIEGKTRGVYYTQVSNDWVCIITIPHSTLLSGFYRILVLYGAALGIFIIVSVIMLIRDWRLSKRSLRSATIINALCNSFYAVYRINIKNGTYTMLKGTTEMVGVIQRQGDYDDMIEGFCTVVDDNTALELRDSFSLAHLRELAAKGNSDFGGDFLRTLDGKKQWVNISFILDDSLDKEEAILAFRKIDREKRSQLMHTKLLEDALEAADASERSQREFFSKMSHEMRTPLNVILGMNELAMRDECAPEKRLDYQHNIELTAKDMLGVVNNILELSRLENGEVVIDKKQFDIQNEFEQIVKPFGEQAYSAGKKLELSIDVQDNMVMGDIPVLAQIMNNILSNALSFTNSGDSITVSLKQAGLHNKNYIFTIEDTGIGMSKSFLPKIFDPYTQEKTFGDRNITSGGLGMTIVKRLVAKKGGQIEVLSREGKGTKVIVTLPFAQVGDNEKPQESKHEPQPFEHMHVMVADDNELNRELLSELLMQEGLTVTQAEDGKEALELFEASEPYSIDLIIMDMQMPVMDGCQSAEAIRALERPDAQSVMIIALTANDFSEDVIRTAKAGMDAHLAKPADMGTLRRTIDRLRDERK